MGKTNSLRKIIQTNISKITKCFCRVADKKEQYPYAVYDIEEIDLGDLYRDDWILVVDVWDKGTDTAAAEDISDQIEAVFNAVNMPGKDVLPTFYRMSRKPIDDEDKTIIHRQLKFQVQNYEIGG